jgi:protein required for attachment to host cells
MNTVWILVCDAAKSRLFEMHPGEPAWTLRQTTIHEGSRSKSSELVSDASGSRSSEGASVRHNALAPASTPKEVAKSSFAHSLVKAMDHWVRSGELREWVLVAPPHFLGLVKSELTPALKKHLLTSVNKDFSHVGAPELADSLRDIVRAASNRMESVRVSRHHAP